MTKQHFERAARIAQDEYLGERDRVQVVNAFVRLFQVAPRFDERRFRAACVPGANVKARS